MRLFPNNQMEDFGDDYKTRGRVQPATTAAFCHPLQLLVRTAVGFSSIASDDSTGNSNVRLRKCFGPAAYLKERQNVTSVTFVVSCSLPLSRVALFFALTSRDE